MNEVTQPERGRGTVFSALALVAALTGLLVLAPMASAASDPIASGTTTITLNNGFMKKLKKSKVKVQKVNPATLKGKVATLPVKEGELDPTNGQGTLTHEGGLKFKRGKKTASVTELVLTSSTASLSAKVGGKKMKFASVTGYSFARNGFGTNVAITKLKLTGKAAKQLNKKLGFTGKKKKKHKRAHVSKKKGKKKAKAPFKGNQVLGGSASETQPKTVAVLPGGTANLTTNQETVEKFLELNVEIEPVSPAEEELPPFPPILKFPITGGTIAPDANAGKVQSGGGVKLVQDFGPGGTTTMTLNAIWVDLDAKSATVEVLVESTIAPALNLGNLGRSSIADISLAGATIGSDPATHVVSVQNANSTLQAVTAEVLNQVFGAPFDALELPHPTFAAGDGLGTFSFSAQTQ